MFRVQTLPAHPAHTYITPVVRGIAITSTPKGALRLNAVEDKVRSMKNRVPAIFPSGWMRATKLPGIFSWKRLFLIYTVPLILLVYGSTALGLFERPDLFLLDRAFQF